MTYKPVGADENGHFPPRVTTALNAAFIPKPATIADGQVVIWNAATSTWAPATPSTVGTAAALSIVFGG